MKDALCRCGHLKSAHLYEEGQCLPGFECETKCSEFRPEPIPNRLLTYLVMPAHEIPGVDATSPWNSPVMCRASSAPGYVHEIDHTHWHCNRCGHVAEIPEEG
jgi:hypothetical protein